MHRNLSRCACKASRPLHVQSCDGPALTQLGFETRHLKGLASWSQHTCLALPTRPVCSLSVGPERERLRSLAIGCDKLVRAVFQAADVIRHDFLMLTHMVPCAEALGARLLRRGEL